MPIELSSQQHTERANELSVIDAFEKRLCLAPKHIATVFESSELSYAELHDYATRIAAQLQSLGLQPEETVGLYLDRSHHAIAAMLGTWLAGGAFVPLDPQYPIERLRFMVEDAAVRVIISCGESSASLFVENGAQLLLDVHAPKCLPAADPRQLIRPSASQLAYIMYTSGSTGTPKGVCIEHGALLNYCHADAEAYLLEPSDRTLQFSTINFDIAIEEVFPPLITGGVVVVRPSERMDAQIELSALIDRYQVTAVHLATGYWHEWVDLMLAAKLKVPASLRLMVVTGEKVSAAHYQRWRELETQPTLWANAYGPTEATVTATVFVPPANWQGNNLPIGKPIKGYSAHILDAQQQAVAEGEIGELYLGGHSIARGYLNRPDAHTGAFVTVDGANGHRERLYRTGDLARWLDTGDIAYAGRLDDQLKIGSFRVELGEIEAALNQYENVFESLVVADQSGLQKSLLAYLACDTDHFELLETYAELQQKLPPHMVPHKFILLQNFPKTINGKIDRAALPDTSTAITPTQGEYQAPASETEIQLAQVWQQQLSLAKVGRHDNFFGLGGDSLLAARTLGAIQTDMARTVSALDFFANPELHQLAACIDAGLTQQPHLVLQAIPKPLPTTPLTASQLRLWLLYTSTELNLSMLHVHEAVQVSGELDLPRLLQALHRVMARHSSLQMLVKLDDSGPVMHWNEHFELPIQQETLATGTSSAQYVEHCVNRERFELDTGPLVRAHLAHCENGDYLLVLVAHHLVADGWSMSILLREIAAIYAGNTPTASPWQFIEFARADNALRTIGTYNAQLDYWNQQLQGLEPVELSQDYKANSNRRFSSKQIDFSLSTEQVQGLESTARQLEGSVHAVLMACFFALLYRHTRSEDIAIATAVHGRNDVQLNNIVGSFIGTLPIRSAVSAQQSFIELVHSVRDHTRAAIANSDVHFDEIVKRVNPVRVDNQLPFSPFVFLLQNIPDSKLQLEGLHCEHLPSPIKASEYDLLLEVKVCKFAGEAQYKARFVYSDELYEHSSIARFCEQFQRLLDQVLKTPDSPISELELLSEHDKHALIHTLNPPATTYDQSLNFVDHIYDQALYNPDKIAVRDDTGKALSYAELCRDADLLALHLQHLGAGPGVLVALSMHRSTATVVALLGILRAGSAYLPMDPTYPAERVSYILNDARAPIVITEHALRHTLPSSDAQVLCMDSDWRAISDVANSGRTLELHKRAGLEDLAYVIYTSGSTGNPKGVQLSHRNVLNFLLAMQQQPGLSCNDKLLAVTTLSFDISVLELYLPLLCGAELMVASRELAIDGKRLAELIESEQVSVLQATPATWRLLIEAGWQGNGRVKGLIGGEALPADILPRLLPMLSSLWNMYGPTETTVWSTCQQITDLSTSISIGKPIANTQVYILDEQQRLCARGTPGELCIAGEGVSLGYTNRADLNASQFLPNPFSEQPGAKLYRTGDLARWLEDGSLSYISRLDNLVKLNGYRIELGEVETVLTSHPAVRQTAVTIHESASGAKRLLAYWVPEAQGSETRTTSDTDDLDFQQYLSTTLPAYMIPQQFVQVPSMPQTPNGKLDRKALPRPPTRKNERAQSGLDTPIQRDIAAQWQQLLEIDNIGPNDQFFNLGGHSLSAIKFINWVEKTHHTSMPMRILIMGTLTQVALHIDPSSSSTVETSQVCSDGLPELSVEFIEKGEVQLFCTHIKSSKPSTRALLLVGSHGYEQSRIDRSYRTLSLKLAKHDVHSMRLDLSGTGNSSLAGTDIHSLESWRDDIRCAAKALLQRSGCDSISLLAARFSASLLHPKMFHDIALDQAFLWDPVVSGAQWWQHRLDLQNRAIASGYYFLKPRKNTDTRGLHTPGLSINNALRADIDAFTLQPNDFDARFHCIRSNDAETLESSQARVISAPDTPRWYDTRLSTSMDVNSEHMSNYVLQAIKGETS